MKGRVYLYFVLTFVLGIIIGGAGMFYYGWHTGRWRRGFSKERVVSHLQQELSLSSPQVQQLSQIIEDSSHKYRQLRGQLDPADSDSGSARQVQRLGSPAPGAEAQGTLTPNQGSRASTRTKRNRETLEEYERCRWGSITKSTNAW